MLHGAGLRILDDEVAGLQRLAQLAEEARRRGRIPRERGIERAVARGVADERAQQREVTDVGGTQHGDVSFAT